MVQTGVGGGVVDVEKGEKKEKKKKKKKKRDIKCFTKLQLLPTFLAMASIPCGPILFFEKLWC